MADVSSITLTSYTFEGVLHAGASLAQMEKDAGRLTGDQYSSFLLGIFQSAVQVPLQKSQMDLANAQKAQIDKDIELKTAQIALSNAQKATVEAQSAADIDVKTAQKNLLVRQKTSLDDAVKRDVAKIVCEALGIIKSGGNNAGSWWDTASLAINNLAGFNIANVNTDPTP